MIHFLDNSNKETNSSLFTQMFRSRAEVFRDRLGWDVEVRDGLEIDRYDCEADPLYLVLTDEDQIVVGSLRLLPTTGDTMMRHEFAHMFDEPLDVRSPRIWECTRFCVPHRERAARHVSAGQASSNLLIELCNFCLENGIDQIIGLYEQPMMRIYRRIGWTPIPFARSKPEIGTLQAGIWDVREAALANMRKLAEQGEQARAA